MSGAWYDGATGSRYAAKHWACAVAALLFGVCPAACGAPQEASVLQPMKPATLDADVLEWKELHGAVRSVGVGMSFEGASPCGPRCGAWKEARSRRPRSYRVESLSRDGSSFYSRWSSRSGLLENRARPRPPNVAVCCGRAQPTISTSAESYCGPTRGHLGKRVRRGTDVPEHQEQSCRHHGRSPVPLRAMEVDGSRQRSSEEPSPVPLTP